jgi:argininosuccinate lyase
MPNKKNPDALELIRGKTGRVYGSLVTLLTTLKALPLAYNKDLQEDKESLFDTVETVSDCLNVLCNIIKTMSIHKDKMLDACNKGFITATEIADYLCEKKVPFREAHNITGNIVKYAGDNNKTLDTLSLQEYLSFSKLFKKDIYKKVNPVNSINNKKSAGSTSDSSVKRQIKQAKVLLSRV